MLLLRQCWGFCMVTLLARTIPSSLAGDALSLFDDEVWQCFSECTTVDTPDPEQQAQISLSRGGVGLRLVSYHYSAKNLVSAIISDLSSEVIKHFNHSIDLYIHLHDPPDSLTPGSVDNSSSSLTQKFLSNKIEDCQFRKLFDSSSLMDRAQLLSISSPHALAWLSVIHRPNHTQAHITMATQHTQRHTSRTGTHHYGYTTHTGTLTHRHTSQRHTSHRGTHHTEAHITQRHTSHRGKYHTEALITMATHHTQAHIKHSTRHT